MRYYAAVLRLSIAAERSPYVGLGPRVVVTLVSFSVLFFVLFRSFDRDLIYGDLACWLIKA